MSVVENGGAHGAMDERSNDGQTLATDAKDMTRHRHRKHHRQLQQPSHPQLQQHQQPRRNSAVAAVPGLGSCDSMLANQCRRNNVNVSTPKNVDHTDDAGVDGDLAIRHSSFNTAFRKAHSVVQLTTAAGNATASPDTQSNRALLSPVSQSQPTPPAAANTQATPATVAPHKTSIQIPIAASTITLTLPTPTAVIIALKNENFASIHLQRIFHHCKVNFYNNTVHNTYSRL